MARRGTDLREHVLWIAKDVFLECGFERASMDEVASRAQTSKRSLYAHFESKEKLFLAVIGLARTLFIERLKVPDEYAPEPEKALVRFLGVYLEILTYRASIQMCRVSLAETERFPEQAAQYFEVLFAEVLRRLSRYLESAFDLSAGASASAAQQLLGEVTYPRFARALFGIDTPPATLGDDIRVSARNLAPIRAAVTRLIVSCQAPPQRT